MRYGIIGSGMMGQEHIRNIALLDEARVVAVADPDDGMREAARALAGPDCKGFADPTGLLDTDLCDALVIATPNDTHFDLLKSALATDLPILIEKPLCTTLDECRTIETMVATRRAPVWVAMEYRYMPPVARLIDAVRAGTAGRVHMLTIREHRFPFLAKVGNWNRFEDRTGGTLVEKCCHFFDLMRLILDARPVRVFASGGMDVNFLDEDYDGRRPDILDNAFVLVDFDTGARAMLDLCMFAEGAYWQEEISATGDRARIDARVPGPARFSADGAERHSEIVISPRETKRPVRENVDVDETILSAGDHHGSTFYQHQRFQRMVADGGDPEVTVTDGLIAVAVGAAAEESVRSGQPVLLADFRSAGR